MYIIYIIYKIIKYKMKHLSYDKYTLYMERKTVDSQKNIPSTFW